MGHQRHIQRRMERQIIKNHDQANVDTVEDLGHFYDQMRQLKEDQS